ncbi:uncharacterized protein LOC123014155 [Tribolium madens]|uniref:uncharacterized protein LOC123014155 n=1 Tax=Tribolium madens TaxID=41895 RepID=UPI001CF7540C|nr:uncharacterized protein LOC123014155 [Tribolium madens]
MGTRKKASELVFNLQWRSKPDNGGDKSNVIGMYDTPTTTSNFEMFKSYLLKNSGVAGNDVKVTYITDNGQEWVIDSQEWFELALSAFRLKARLGEVIFLKLDKIFSSKHLPRKDSNDVETQFDMDSMDNSMIAPPEWFVTYMKQFKRDVVEEVTFAVTSNIIANKDKEVPVATPASSKRNKPEFTKRSRKHGENPIDKELFKTLKFDMKLENKLDKLDAKTKKIKEKKQALINKISCAEDRHGSGKRSHFLLDTSSFMNASLVNECNTGVYEHMLGGDVYLHTWQVINSGMLPWTRSTELRLTWGSTEMVPASKTIRCPLLQPGEKGTISVRFEIPKKPGTYESYWNFYDKDVRFGKSLSCCVIVDRPLSSILNVESPKKPLGKVMFCSSGAAEVSKPLPVNDNHQMEESVEKMFNIAEKQPICVQVPKHVKEVVIFPEDSENNINASIEIPEGVKRLVYYPNRIEPEESSPFFDLSKLTNSFKTETQKSADLEENMNVSKLVYFPNEFAELDKKSPSKENIDAVNKTLAQMPMENATTLANSVIDLSRRIQNIKIVGTSQQDSDSEWESVWSYGKMKNKDNQSTDFEDKATNKYGIAEKDLIVDLSKKSKEFDKVEKDEENVNVNDDKNNNNGAVENNNSTGESISEIASEASSDLSSGYDVVNDPVCEEKEENSGYVYITFDGNKLPVPKHILRPDFLVNAEEAPGPLNSEDEEKIDNASQQKIPDDSNSVKLEQIHPKEEVTEQCVQEKSFMSHCSATGSCFSDVTSGKRLFIFPQSNPGYEVFYPSQPKMESEKIEKPVTLNIKDETKYTWAHQAPCSHYLKTDPYGPLDQSQAGSLHNPAVGHPTSSHPHPIPHHQNMQQSERKQFDYGLHHRPAPKPSVKEETPSAPPQPPQAEYTPQVHILPENLVSGAVNVASSAINTARSVINMIVPKAEPGKWVNGHWVTENPDSIRAKNLLILAEMGFWDADLNATLLARYNDDLARVISELVQ